MEALVNLQDVTKRYHTTKGEINVIEGLSFSVEQGEFLSIVGPSGCGKSTILSIIAGLVAPSGGSVQINGEEVTGHSDSVAYMLQRDHLFEWRTIEENIMLGLQIQRKCTKQARENALSLLDKYGLGEFRKYHPQQLSGGMRQKVALIRTLAVDPKILLLDEPFSSLDYQTRLALSDDIADIIRTEKKTAVLVTHDIAEAISMSNRVLVLAQRPTKIKSIVEIAFGSNCSPIQKRKEPKFQTYFDYIWRELSVHVE